MTILCFVEEAMERVVKVGKKFILGFCVCGCGKPIAVRNKLRILARFTKGHNNRLKVDRGRVCYACDSITTYVTAGKWANWHIHNGYTLCGKCYSRYVLNPISHQKNSVKETAFYSPKRIRFKGKRIYLKENPRIGVCNLCRAVNPFDCKLTNMHHEEYNERNPSAHTIEVCPRCHYKRGIGII